MLVKRNWPLAILPPWGSHSNQLTRMLPLRSWLEGEEAWRNRRGSANTIFLSFLWIRLRSQGVCGHTAPTGEGAPERRQQKRAWERAVPRGPRLPPDPF